MGEGGHLALGLRLDALDLVLGDERVVLELALEGVLGLLRAQQLGDGLVAQVQVLLELRLRRAALLGRRLVALAQHALGLVGGLQVCDGDLGVLVGLVGQQLAVRRLLAPLELILLLLQRGQQGVRVGLALAQRGLRLLLALAQVRLRRLGALLELVLRPGVRVRVRVRG